MRVIETLLSRWLKAIPSSFPVFMETPQASRLSWPTTVEWSPTRDSATTGMKAMPSSL